MRTKAALCWTTTSSGVFGNDTGEPCYGQGTTTADRWCQQAWQWNLDRVIDTSGNEIDYTYTRETNYYARFSVASNSTSYDRGGWLQKVEYGFDRSNGQ